MMKMSDAIIEEIRRTRDEYARQCNYDLHAMCADLRREQELSGAQVVSFAKSPTTNRPVELGVQTASAQ